MQTRLIIASAIVLALTSTLLIKDNASVVVPKEIHNLYSEWKFKNGRLSATPSENNFRLGVFYQNYLTVTEVNSRQSSYTLGLNQFADMTDEEIEAKYTSKNIESIFEDSEKPRADLRLSAGDEAPESIDWRDKHVVGPVKNQQACGSCWAFASVSVMESMNSLVNQQSVVLSEQQLVDCSTQNNGCHGGLMNKAFKYVLTAGGVTTNSSYPYVAKEQICQFKEGDGVVTISDYGMLIADQGALKYVVGTHSPVSIAVYSNPLFRYTSGVFNDYEACTQGSINHAVVAIGYGTTEAGQDYWLVRNSWGPNWGESGYVKMARTESGPGLCGLASFSVYVEMNQ